MINVEEPKFYTVDDIMRIFAVKKTKAYTIIRELNDELKKKGKITIAGKVNRKYIDERI